MQERSGRDPALPEPHQPIRTIADSIFWAAVDLVRYGKSVFTREDVRQELGVDRDLWNRSYNPAFQGLRCDDPGGAPRPSAHLQGVFERLERGQYQLSGRGYQLLEGDLLATRGSVPEVTTFRSLINAVITATSRIEPHYFHLPVVYQEQGIERERVYCYELYHLLRSHWSLADHYKLAGEVDKSGHPLFRREDIFRKKPDFIVHQPGTMERNLAVVEVKPINASRDAIDKDIETISGFLRHADYFGGIYLVYGSREGRLQPYKDALMTIGRNLLDRVVLLHHSEPGIPAKIVPLV